MNTSFDAFKIALLGVLLATPAIAQIPLYRDSRQTIDKRVEDLLGRMTLEEKVGQMNMPSVYLRQLGQDVTSKRENCRRFTEGTLVKGLGPCGGFFTLANTILDESPHAQAAFFNQLQRIAVERTRLGIPLLQTEEGTHGLACPHGTVFPEGLALGSAWDLDLIERVYSAAASEARAVGIHQLFTVVVEPYRDPRLGRNQEGFSEDPWYCGRIAESIVRGMQGDDISAPDRVVAGLCHFPGQSEPLSGMERGAMHVSERKLRQVFLPPWVAGIKKMGALGVMATYPAIDFIPTHSSEWLLTRILRDELGFRGLVLSEGRGIASLIYERVAANQKAAGQIALRAGVDVGISFEEGYMLDLIESVREGTVPMALVDRAVRRILAQKFRLGLFEKPYVDVEHAEHDIDRKRNRQLALDAARRGIVLLKNDGGVLPIAKSVRSIAVIGPNADNRRNQLGDYVPKRIPQSIVTVLEGIRGKLPGAKVTHVPGCDVIGERVNQIAEAAKAAREADVAVVVVGEAERNGPRATGGEGHDVASLDLTGMQEDLIRAVHATGKPTVVVLINGRPLSLRWTAAHVPAIVEAWFPGEQGGLAVADVLFGDINPSGRLPVTVPRHSGQLPMFYNYDAAKAHWMREPRAGGAPYVDMPATPLFAFGHGLSYTRFDYTDIKVSPAKISTTGTVKVALTVTNSGKVAGEELVQLYVKDVLASVGRPDKELKGFQRVALTPGESKRISIPLAASDLAFLDRSMKWIVEPGRFDVMVGASAEDIRLNGSFEVIASPAAPRYIGKSGYLNGAHSVVVHSFDDAVPEVIQALDLLDRYEVKATAFINTSKRGVGGLWSRLKRAIENGHEVGAHSRRHRCAWPDTEEVCRRIYSEDEVFGARNGILVNTGQRHVWSWAYPCGLCPRFDFVRNLIAAAGFIVGRNYPGEAEDRHNVPDLQEWGTNPFDIAYTQVVQKRGGIAKTGRTNTEANNAKFDEVHRRGGIYHFVSHTAWLGLGSDSFYEDHLKHISGRNDVWYVPLGFLYAYREVRNAAEVRELAPGRFSVRHTLDPNVYATGITLEFESTATQVLSNGKALKEHSGPATRADREWFCRERGRLLVTLRPNTILEIR